MLRVIREDVSAVKKENIITFGRDGRDGTDGTGRDGTGRDGTDGTDGTGRTDGRDWTGIRYQSATLNQKQMYFS